MRTSQALVPLAIAGSFLLHAHPASAQAAAPSQSEAAGKIETGANAFGLGNSIFGSGVDCARVASVQQHLQVEANAYQRLGKGFGNIGYLLTAIAGSAQLAQGNGAGATQTATEFALDKIVCNLATVAGCVGWTAGRTIGAFVKMFPVPGDPQQRSIESWVTDREFELVGPYYARLMGYMNEPGTVENFRAAYATYQAQLADIAARQRAAEGRAAQCKAKEESKTAIEEALEKAKAAVGRTMMSSASDPTLAEDAGLARSSATSAMERARSQMYSEQAAAMSQRSRGGSALGMGALGASSSAAIPANSQTCAAAKAQIAEDDRWLAEVEPNKNATSEHADAYALVKDARAQNQSWYNANCH